MTPALETRALTRNFGGLIATDCVNLSIAAGARHALIGPNGAGKTTLINLLTGVLAPSSGQIWLAGNDITGMPAEQRVARGMARTFQINQLFPRLSSREALALAICQRNGNGHGWWRKATALGPVADEIDAVAERFGLTDGLDQRAATLAYGKQRQLEIALAFACRPSLLLLDEPAAGVPEHERHELLEAIANLPKSVTVLLIEHDMDLVFKFADRISVMVNGALFSEGPPQVIANDPRVRAVYLGEASA